MSMLEPEGPFDAGSSQGVSQGIPDKLYFRIGEVSRLLGVEAYVLRYWETEFPSLSPKKSDTGQRMYRRKDVEQLLHIKELLYSKRFTIEGARQSLAERLRQAKESKTNPIPAAVEQRTLFGSDGAAGNRANSGSEAALPEIRRELEAILEILR